MLKEGRENNLIWDRVGFFSMGCLYPPLEAVSDRLIAFDWYWKGDSPPPLASKLCLTIGAGYITTQSWNHSTKFILQWQIREVWLH